MTRLLTEDDLREATGLFVRLGRLRTRAEWPTPQLKRAILAAETRLKELRVDPGATVWAKAPQQEPTPA
jgi:hypothetical protein